MGLRRKYHGTAVGAVLGMAVVARVRNFHVGRGTTKGEASWILEDNMPMRRMIESFGGRPLHKRPSFGIKDGAEQVICGRITNVEFDGGDELFQLDKI